MDSFFFGCVCVCVPFRSSFVGKSQRYCGHAELLTSTWSTRSTCSASSWFLVLPPQSQQRDNSGRMYTLRYKFSLRRTEKNKWPSQRLKFPRRRIFRISPPPLIAAAPIQSFVQFSILINRAAEEEDEEEEEEKKNWHTGSCPIQFPAL